MSTDLPLRLIISESTLASIWIQLSFCSSYHISSELTVTDVIPHTCIICVIKTVVVSSSVVQWAPYVWPRTVFSVYFSYPLTVLCMKSRQSIFIIKGTYYAWLSLSKIIFVIIQLTSILRSTFWCDILSLVWSRLINSQSTNSFPF